MDTQNPATDLLEFFKALADANRLRIIGLLAQKELSGEQLAEILNVRPSTISHHLAKLVRTGLVSTRTKSYYTIYRFEPKVLEALSERLLSSETLPAVAENIDIAAYDRKVLNNYLLPDGRLKEIPTQQKKLLVILKHIIQAFEPERRYSEKQVNAILTRYHEDYARLRRELVNFHMLGREGGGGEYWLLSTEPEGIRS